MTIVTYKRDQRITCVQLVRANSIVEHRNVDRMHALRAYVTLRSPR
jgi:hypothetical protein